MSFNPRELKAARVRRGISQKDLAEMLNCTSANYCMKENGLRRFFVSEANNIARILKLTDKEIINIFFAININSNDNKNLKKSA